MSSTVDVEIVQERGLSVGQDVSIRPRGQLDVLSKREVAQLLDTSNTGLYQLYRNCSLAVLNSGAYSDDCLLYTSPSPRDVEESRMPSSA